MAKSPSAYTVVLTVLLGAAASAPARQLRAPVEPPASCPCDAAFPVVARWLDTQNERIAWAALPPSTGQTCITIDARHRPEVLQRWQWIALSERCGAAIDHGPAAERIEALNFAAWQLAQVAWEDKTLTQALSPGLGAAIVSALASEDPSIRRAAAGTAYSIASLTRDPSIAIPALAHALKDPDAKTRCYSAGAIGSLCYNRDGLPTGLGIHAALAVAALIEGLDDTDAGTRSNCFMAIGASGDAGRAAIPALVEHTTADDGLIRRQALMALERLGPRAVDAVPALMHALHHEDERTRSTAALAVGAVGPGAWPAVSDLIALLDDPTDYVTWHAARALGDIGPAAAPALPRLRAAVALDPDAFSGCGAAAIEQITLGILKREPR